jgi:hypothetical protein
MKQTRQVPHAAAVPTSTVIGHEYALMKYDRLFDFERNVGDDRSIDRSVLCTNPIHRPTAMRADADALTCA